jgi:hypothetical protein
MSIRARGWIVRRAEDRRPETGGGGSETEEGEMIGALPLLRTALIATGVVYILRALFLASEVYAGNVPAAISEIL